MSIRTIAVIAAITVVALAGAGWIFRDSPAVRESADSAAGFGRSILPDNSYTVVTAQNEKAAGKIDKSGGTNPLRKCVSDSRTVYTDEKCPAGMREAPISEGNVTVVPAPRIVEKAKTSEEKAK